MNIIPKEYLDVIIDGIMQGADEGVEGTFGLMDIF